MKLILYLAISLSLFLTQNLSAQTSKSQAKFNHLAIFVKDIKVSRSFYSDVIGLDSIAEPFHDGKHIWYGIGPAMSLHVIAGAETKKEYFKNQHICLSVQSVEAFTQRLTKGKVEFEDIQGKKNSITTRVDGVKQIWFRDPDGYWIEINDAKL